MDSAPESTAPLVGSDDLASPVTGRLGARHWMSSTRARTGARLAFVSLAYFATGWLGLKFPYYGSQITLIWFPTGIAVSALLRWGIGMWPAVALAAFLVNWTVGPSLLLASGIAVGNTLAPLAAAWWLKSAEFDHSFSRQSDVASFIAATVVCMFISATGGVTALYFAGLVSPSHFADAWLGWWVGDAEGLLLGGPILLPLTRRNWAVLRQRIRRYALWALLAGATAWLAFGAKHGHLALGLPIALLTLPLLAWGALNFGIIAAALSCLGFATLAVWGASRGVGAFHIQDADIGLILLWSYIGTSQLIVLMLSALQAERESAVAVLHKSEERLRLMTESVQDYAIFMLDPDGRVISWSESSARICGHSESEILGKPFEAFFAPDDVAAGRPTDLLRLAKQAGRAHDLGWIARSAGDLFFADTTLSAVYASTGKLVGISAVTRDITEKKLAELEQHRLNRALRLLGQCNLLLAQVENEASLLDGCCRLIVGPGSYEMAWVGIPEHDAEQSVRVVAHAGDDRGYLESVRISWNEDKAIGRGPTGTAIRTATTVVDQDVHGNAALAPWRDAFVERGYRSSIGLPLASNNVAIGALTLYASEPNAFGAAEVRLLEELARNLSFGIQMLRTRQERDSAQAATQAKSRFLANMSHEIRTPLNAIVGMAHLLRRDGVTPRQAERIDMINSSADHLLHVINDILDLSKIEAGSFTLEKTEVVVEALLGNVVSILSPRAQAKGLNVRLEVEGGRSRLLGDPTRLTQALLNYANNAVKFTNAGVVTLRAQPMEESATSVLVRFEVEDTGIGIAPDILPRLFTAFQQADGSTTRQYGGTGLGLAITKRFAQLMGGDAGATSRPGRGSTFWFTARLEKSPAPANRVELPAIAVNEARLRSCAAGKVVLLVEDEPINREIAEEFLSTTGLRVSIAENGAKAVNLAESRHFDLILMDIQMPEMDGLTATKHIRRISGRESVPIVAMTANAFVEDRERCINAGMNDFLPKPFMPEEFYGTLLRWLSPSGRTGPVSISAPGLDT